MGKRKMTIIVNENSHVHDVIRSGLPDVTVISEDEFIEPVTLRFVIEARYDRPPISIGMWPDMNGYCRDLKYEVVSRVFIRANDVKITGEVMKNG